MSASPFTFNAPFFWSRRAEFRRSNEAYRRFREANPVDPIGRKEHEPQRDGFNRAEIFKILGQERYQETLDYIHALVDIKDLDIEHSVRDFKTYPVLESAIISNGREYGQRASLYVAGIKSKSREIQDDFKFTVLGKTETLMQMGHDHIPTDNLNDENNRLVIVYRFAVFLEIIEWSVMQDRMAPWTEDELWAARDLWTIELKDLSMLTMRVNGHDAARIIEEAVTTPEVATHAATRIASLRENTFKGVSGRLLVASSKLAHDHVDQLPSQITGVAETVTGAGVAIGLSLQGLRT